jgi:hypothetical protein
MCSTAARVDNPLRDALAVDMIDLLAQNKILEKDRTAPTDI